MERRGTLRRKEGKENTRERKRKEERKKRKYTEVRQRATGERETLAI